uniref:Chemokine interleukin-8-like domain-containing protein n=1 Tax=Hucho hucho TaxID=62062 RepID=A0A4W5KBX1_9TELE
MTNTMTSTVLISFLACLLLVNVEALAKLHYLPVQSLSPCIFSVTLKNGKGKKCLNPDAPFAKKTIAKIMKNQRSVQ